MTVLADRRCSRTSIGIRKREDDDADVGPVYSPPYAICCIAFAARGTRSIGVIRRGRHHPSCAHPRAGARCPPAAQSDHLNIIKGVLPLHLRASLDNVSSTPPTRRTAQKMRVDIERHRHRPPPPPAPSTADEARATTSTPHTAPSEDARLARASGHDMHPRISPSTTTQRIRVMMTSPACHSFLPKSKKKPQVIIMFEEEEQEQDEEEEGRKNAPKRRMMRLQQRAETLVVERVAVGRDEERLADGDGEEACACASSKVRAPESKKGSASKICPCVGLVRTIASPARTQSTRTQVENSWHKHSQIQQSGMPPRTARPKEEKIKAGRQAGQKICICAAASEQLHHRTAAAAAAQRQTTAAREKEMRCKGERNPSARVPE
ncbi:hypothetical protein B0H16DRAFT_1691471 [Mycena metata]|uniref:Uncharacterized protein n=1 Tax=Mycena metata TaxID=1033252 RepID=A0AAD7N906_9AGAR|nr:hypothetical protein B0H16DRAFT_1691471 [Mycena metata]